MLSPFDLRLKSAQLSGIFFNVEHDHIKYPRGLNTAVSLLGRRCCAQFWSPWWKRASPAVPPAACPPGGPPRDWPSLRCRSSSQPGW